MNAGDNRSIGRCCGLVKDWRESGPGAPHCRPPANYGEKLAYCVRLSALSRSAMRSMLSMKCSTPVTPCANTTARRLGDGNCFPNGAVKSRQKHRSAHWRIKTILWIKKARSVRTKLLLSYFVTSLLQAPQGIKA